jgi:hypothetical protein
MLEERERDARIAYNRIAHPDPSQPNEVMDYLLAEWLTELIDAVRAASEERDQFERDHPAGDDPADSTE